MSQPLRAPEPASQSSASQPDAVGVGDGRKTSYDAILLVSFGGPEGPDEVMPFLENVLRGRNVPRERMLEVAEHYQHFGGVSPINEQNRALLEALQAELEAHGPKLPVYWGNRNWHPLLTDTLQEMSDAGVQRAIAFVTSGFSCYSGCRQYRENIAAACEPLGDKAPTVA
jgi:ferrochelatase